MKMENESGLSAQNQSHTRKTFKDYVLNPLFVKAVKITKERQKRLLKYLIDNGKN